MSAHHYLRDLTREAHDRVDATFSIYNLSIIDDYRRFLVVHAAAYLPVEAALAKAGAGALFHGWSERRRGDFLRQDLASLGIAEPTPATPPQFDGDAAIAGGVYVLEGSRLGGAMLRSKIGAGFPRAFLDPPSEPGAWKRFVAELEQILYSRVRQEAAGMAALSTFACFEEAALFE